MMTKWMESQGPLKGYILSSRIRLARNFSEYPFPMAMSPEAARSLISAVRTGVYEKNTGFKETHQFLETEKLSPLEKHLMVEKHLTSSEFMNGSLPGAIILNGDESISVMVNEEDHLRIQCLLPGLQLDKAWESAGSIDDYIDEMMDYAFDEKLGYLTSCPTNLGTGLRASVMMHLPALTLTGTMDGILQAAGRIGLAVRGLYGEGSEAMGAMYQISNQLTLGRKETELIDTLTDVAGQIAAQEKKARESLMKNNQLELEDRIWRSFGALTQARILSTKEALERLSDLRLGIEVGVVPHLGLDQVDQLLFRIQPAFLQSTFKCELTPAQRDQKRAEWVRTRLGQ